MMLLMAVKRDEDKVCELKESKTHAKQEKGKREREVEKKGESERGEGAYSKSSLIAATKRGASFRGCICETLAKKLRDDGVLRRGTGEGGEPKWLWDT